MNRLLLFAALLLSAAIGFGQTILATVTGTISDSTGAVIADVPVVLRNLENGQVYNATSSSTGNFTVSQVQVGDYDLMVASPGFKTYTHTMFHLSAGQTMREDVILEVGQATESVTVSAEASLLKTETSELAHNVTLSQMNNLPLLSVGVSNQGFRDPFSAVRLVPGVSYTQNAASNTMVINGTPANTFQTRLDGQTQNPTGSRLMGATGQTQPSVDALQEVAIQTSNFAAEYGTAGGAVINMVTKSGTNQFHGSVYDYMRNEALDAHQPYTGLRNKVRQQDWGFTVGGPVKIPKIYDGTNKTFFFWSYEQYRNKQIITTAATTVPIDAYRNGDFSNLINQENRYLTVGGTTVKDPLGREIRSGTIFDPNNFQLVNGVPVREVFPENRIPLSRIDPTSAKILESVPRPFGVNADRGQAGNNYQAPYDQSRTSQIPSIKIDQNLGAKNRVSFYWQNTKSDTPRTATGADNYPDLITASVSSVTSARTARVNWDYTATTRLLLHFGAGWNDTDFVLASPVIDYNAMTELGLRQAQVRNFPRFAVGAGNANANVAALGGMSSLGTTTQESSYERRPSGNISATYVTGGHTFKAGVEYRLEKYPSYNFASTAGVYTFGAAWTTQPSLQTVSGAQGFAGFPLASFMLGGFSGMTMNAPTAASTSKSQTAIYLQDNWKVTRKLTLDYGIRWDYGTYAREQYGRYSSFRANIPNPSASGRLGARAFEATCGCNFAGNYPYAIGPRLGFAYQWNDKTVFRGGVGIVYDATATASGGPVNAGFSSTPGFGQVVGLLQNGTPAEVQPVWPTFDPGASQAPGTVVAQPFTLDGNAGRPARLLQWNFTVQREINRDLVLEAAYVANRGVWWEANGLAAQNLLSESVLRSYGFNDFTSRNEADLLVTNFASLTPGQKSILAQRGITGQPYANFPITGTTSQTARQSLLPFPQYTGQSIQGAPLGNTWYDAFQLTVNKRFSHGLTFNFNYNWSKNLELMSSSDVFNRANGKNLSGNDRPHQLRITAQYQVPELRNSGIAGLSNKYVSYALSGWGLGVYMSYQSAALVGRPASTGSVPISQFLGRGPGTAQLKTDAFGDYMNPWSVDWYDYDGKHHTDPIDINCHCFDPTKTVVLNPNVWENVPNGQWAANQSSIRSFRGIRFPTENANVSRNFRFGKEGRYVLNVRVEFNNVFNRTQYPAISLGTGFNDIARTFPAGSGLNTGLYSGGFGTINPTSGTTGQRTGTFIGRFTF